MELSEEQLNKIYERKERLGAFLGDCAISIFWRVTDHIIEDLPDQEVIDLVDWWKKKQSEQKYTVKVFPNSFGYLTTDDSLSKTFSSNLAKSEGCRTAFTKQEIEQLKQRGDIAIDWDKAIIEPVEE